MAKLIKEFTPGRGYSKEDWDEVADAPELTDEQASQRMTIEEAARRKAPPISGEEEGRNRAHDRREP